MDEPGRAEPSAAAMLRAYLAERDEPCPNCGYNLRGLGSERCPECDQRLVLSVQVAEPRMGMLLAGVVGLMAMGAPGAAVAALTLTLSVWHQDWPPRDILFWAMVYPGVCGGALLAGAWLLGRRRGRRWLRSLPPERASRVVGWCWGASLVVGGVFVVALLNMR
jgi:hypothetical protein